MVPRPVGTVTGDRPEKTVRVPERTSTRLGYGPGATRVPDPHVYPGTHPVTALLNQPEPEHQKSKEYTRGVRET